MRLRTLVCREIFERKSQLLTSFLAILLGITVIVSIKNISYYSENGRGAGNGLAGGQRAGAPQVVHLAGLLRGRHAGRDDSRGIRHQAGDVGPGRAGQHLAQIVASRRTPRQDLHAHRHPAQERVSGQGRLGRGGHLLAAHRLRGLGRHDGLGGQEDARPQAGHRNPRRQRSPGGRRRGREARDSRMPTSWTC